MSGRKPLPAGGRWAFGVGFGLLFLCMLTLTLVYAPTMTWVFHGIVAEARRPADNRLGGDGPHVIAAWLHIGRSRRPAHYFVVSPRLAADSRHDRLWCRAFGHAPFLGRNHHLEYGRHGIHVPRFHGMLRTDRAGLRLDLHGA